MKRSVDYICMQPTRQGQASYAHVNEIVAGLRRRGWDVRLVEPPLPRPGRADGPRRAIAAATTQLRYWWACRFRPARVVYVRSHFLTLPTALLAKLRGSIVVQEVNGPETDVFDSWPLLRPLAGPLLLVGRAQIRMADAIVVVTPGLAAYVRAKTGRRDGYHVIGNGADVDRFHPRAVLPGMPGPAPRYVVFIGALASWQGIDTILDARDLAEWPDDVEVVIAGDGRERGRVVAAAARDPRIRWLGTIPYDQASALLAGSIAALVPKADAPAAQFGLSPLKLFESMAAGVPIVVSDLAGLSDVIRAHRCGLVIAPGDAHALAQAVAEISADPRGAAAMGSRGRDAAVQFYSWDARACETESLLLALLDRRPRGRRPVA